MSTTKPITEGDENAANDRVTSRVLEFGCAKPQEMAAAMLVSLRLHTDAWDLAEDLTRDETSIVVLDTRPKKAYEEAHIPGARSFPHREMTESSTRTLDRSKVYVLYCDGIGCNGSTKGASSCPAWASRPRSFSADWIGGGAMATRFSRDRNPETFTRRRSWPNRKMPVWRSGFLFNPPVQRDVFAFGRFVEADGSFNWSPARWVQRRRRRAARPVWAPVVRSRCCTTAQSPTPSVNTWRAQSR